MNKLMTKEFFESDIERLKSEGKLPKDFKITKIETHPNGVMKSAVGYSSEKDIVWWNYQFGAMMAYRYDYASEDAGEVVAVTWDRERKCPDLTTTLQPWNFDEKLVIRTDPVFLGFDS